MKRIIPVMMAAVLTCTGLPLTARADSAKVVTLGANLTAEQKTSMYKYFGTTADAVDTIEVTNADERKYMEGIASEAQIGTRTYSCSYVEPTTSGGIQVKVGNLTFVTSSMIASTLLTSGVENCNVVAASPIEVSGTGALTGIMMAYEKASGKTLSEEQKAAATEELVTTGELADSIGQKDAADLMNEVKQEVIKDGLTDEGEIQDAINDAAKTYNITLTEDQMSKISSLMQNISQYDYDVNALKKTLENLEGKGGKEGFFSSLWSSIKGIFTGDSDSGDGGIINDTNDDVLGADAIIDSTLEALDEETKKEGFWDKVTNFFKGLFGGSDDDADEEETTDEEDADKEDSEDTENPEDAADTSDDESLDTGNPDGTADPDAALNPDGTDGTDPNAANDGVDPNAQTVDPASSDGTGSGAAADGLSSDNGQTADPAAGFRFKQFGVDDRRSALRVGTDGVLVGAWAVAPQDAIRMLDVGAGCGVIALMLAQRYADALITASEIDAGSVDDLRLNILNSPWSDRISVAEGDFNGVDGVFDLIASNPPYFTNGELAPDASRARARHASCLSPVSLIRYAAAHLSPDGVLAMITPVEQAPDIEAEAAFARLSLKRRTDVATSPRRGVTRTLWEFTKAPCALPAPGRLDLNSDDYRILTRDFYLHF